MKHFIAFIAAILLARASVLDAAPSCLVPHGVCSSDPSVACTVSADCPAIDVVIVAVSAGNGHSLALDATGRAWSWGDNIGGELGDGTQIARSLPQPVPGLAGVVSITTALRVRNSMVALDDGSVWGWGANGRGQLGTGMAGPQALSPTQGYLAGSFSEVTLGDQVSSALDMSGGVWSAGWRFWGQIGDGSSSNASLAVPTQVVGVGGIGFLTGIIEVERGDNHVLALHDDGRVFSWGRNGSGQLGAAIPNTEFRTPVEVLNVSNATDIAAGGSHSLAVEGGNVWGFGNGTKGQIGAPAQSESVPRLVPGLTNIVDVDAGTEFTLALRSDGTVFGLGVNSDGQLGDGTTVDTTSTPVMANIVNVTAVSAGSNYSLAVLSDGSAWAWGRNFRGKLGDLTELDRASPVQVLPIPDQDADGIATQFDNCPADANVLQVESDFVQAASFFGVLDPAATSFDAFAPSVGIRQASSSLDGILLEFSCGTCDVATFNDAVTRINSSTRVCGLDPEALAMSQEPFCARSAITGQTYDVVMLSYLSSSFDPCVDGDGGASCAAAGGLTSYLRSGGDGLGDSCDNCPATQNADQTDSDGNGIGDACEEPFDPAGAIRDLVDDVLNVDLPGSLDTALQVQLNLAAAALATGDIPRTIFFLESFINIVDHLPGRVISQADAEALIASAQEIVTALGS